MKGAKSKAWDWTKWSFHVWSTYYASKCCESMKLAQKCRVDTCSRTLWTSLDGSIGWCWSTAEVVKWIDVAQTPAKLQYFATSPRSQNHEWLNTALDPQTIRNKWWWVSPNNQVLCRVSSWFFTSIGFFLGNPPWFLVGNWGGVTRSAVSWPNPCCSLELNWVFQ